MASTKEARIKAAITSSRTFAIKNNQDPNRPYHNKDWLEEEHVIKQRSIVEIADECGVSSRTIHRWFRKFNITTKGYERMKDNPAWIESMAAAQRGRVHSEEAKKKMRLAKIGKPLSEEHRRKIGLAHRGDKNHNWRGGKTEWRNIVRGRAAYAEWRTKVFEHDDYTCQECGRRGGNLEAHHKKLRIIYPELVYRVSNGETLCLACHWAVNHQVLQKQQEIEKREAISDFVF